MKKLLLYIFIGSCLIGSAQTKEERADNHFNDFKFDKAIVLYKELAAKKSRPSIHVMKNLADSYFNINDYISAKPWYEKLYGIQGKEFGEGNIIKLVQCLKANKQNDHADNLLKEFYTDKDRLKIIMTQKKYLDSLEQEKEKYEVSNLALNGKKSDFAPVYFNDRLIFASARDSIKSNGKLYPWNKQPYLDLYVTNPNDANYIPEKFLNNLESDYHDATLTFSWDGSTVFFTRNYLKKKNKLSTNEDGLSNMEILRGTIVNNELMNVTSLSFNSKKYSCGHPALSPDGRFLYFTSNMPGGYGESDIYLVELNPSGDVLSDPMNLGPSINTRGREMFPFVRDERMYFSSDGHYGYGGLDVFGSVIFSKTDYSMPMNMGTPINSNMDDFSFIREKEKGNGFVASNRPGGKGDDDIYRFEKVKPVKCLEYSGYVLNKQTNEPIAQASLELTNTTDELVHIVRTDENGYYNVILPCNKENNMVFYKAGFTKETVKIVTGEAVEEPSLNNMVYLTAFESLIVKEDNVEKIKVDPIYFDYDKSDITARAEIELEKVLFAMREFPDLKIKIESHTDSRGTDSYNLKLSDDRAKSTSKYLKAQGIASNRIESANGYGETLLKNKCKNGVRCSEQEHLLNRRSNFIIVSKEGDTVIEDSAR
ncbi:OmpA family protein [Aurantibacter crassamenti]|uniref:OmpA family protein n=1 Tax=Aurantibacter crassamenti TaxID=1837375 RepID=UPI001939E950|nr:OmpA family protein [Aurantibacter crassamenti]MBM1107737.1 OmpA family protein [Aurantibacter crassamenti]